MLLVVSKVNQPARTAPPRRGVVLLVVIAMLVLFASVGLSFVYYAQAEANNTGLSTQAERRLFGGTDMDPELLLAYFLGQFTSGVDDKVDITTAHSAFSSMRGHDLATTMWGYNRHGLNVIPFNGPGRSTEMDADLGKPINQLINYTYFPFEVVGAAPGQKLVRDPGRLANRKAPAVPTTNNPTMIDWLAPEWNNYVAGNAPFTYADLNNVFLGQMNANGEVLIQSFWRPWTLELAGVANPLEPNDPNNPLWTPFTVPNPQRPALDPQMAWRKYATVRPLPWYNPKFKPPADGGGDVKNLDFAKGVPIRDAAGMPTGKYYHNDSIWMDLGFPTRVGPDGRKYKPLFAPLIIDLDGKVNLNIAGNYRINAGGTLDHASNFGLTPAEISLKRVLANPALPGNTEWLNILGHPLYGRYGSQDTTPPVPGRMSGVPMGEVNEWRPPALSMVGPPFYGAGDLDSVRIDPASKERSPFERISLPGPGAPGTLPQSHVPFPYVPTETYGNGNADERLDHPWLFNYFAPNYVPAGRTVQADDRLFPLYELEALWRHGGTGSAGLSADLFKAAPTTFSALAGGQRSRLLVTPWSMDVARPGNAPWLQGQALSNYLYTFPAAPGQPEYPTPDGLSPASMANPSPGVGEYVSSAVGPAYVARDYRAFAGKDPRTVDALKAGGNLAQIQALTSLSKRLNINRSLTPYPPAEPGGFIDTNKTEDLNGNGALDPGEDLNGNNVIDNYGVIYAQAVAERQQLAKDIFDRLRYVTTGDRPGTPITPPAANPDPNFDALRWLAQLAVNIVDFRDFDDYNTPFLWWTDSTGTLPPPSNMQYVYGTELPQLVLNEVYAESANDPADIAGMTATQKYMINFWVELVNPHVAEPAYLRRQHLKVESPLGIWDPYQIEVVEPPAAMPSAIDRSKLDNTAGDPDPAAPVVLRVTDFTPSIKDPFPLDKNYHYVVQPANLNMAGTWKQKPDTMMMPKDYCDNDGFYVVGPQEFEFPRDPTAAMPPPSPPYPVASVRVRDDVAAMPKHGLTREFMTANIADPANLPQRHSVLLRRLACPHMPPDATVGSPTYNPYITVDYVDNVPTQPAVRFDTNGMQPAGFVPYDQRRSKYRDHPFNSHQGNLLDSAPMPANVSHPQHTFFRHNINDPINPPPPFDWLVHLDRNFTSPIELLHVGGYRPFELTYKFKQGGNAHQHVVPNPWGDSRARVYRFLEFVDAGYRMNGVPQDGQVPGKININTIWDEEVLQAILDAQPNSSFQAVNSGGFNGTIVQQLFQQMMQSRSPQGRPAGESVDKPFKPLSTPYTGTAAMPNDGSGVEATILRQPGGALLFDTKSTDATSVPVIPNHPYVKFELLSKLFNNVTTRSNVFAVWLTVGFFEVIDEDTNGDGVLHPSEDANRSGTLDAGEDTNGNGQLDLNEDINGNGFLDRELLGEEIGRAENRHVRHRMFAIVDRTTMVMPQVLGKTFVDIKAGATTPVPVKRVRLNAPFYTEFKLREGMEVEIVDNLANPTIEETVQLLKVTYSTNPTTPPTIEAVFTKDHPAGSLIIVPRVLDAMPGPTMKGIIEQEPPLPAAPVVQDIPTIHGNPGPQLRFDHRKSKGLVPYYSIIQ